MNVAIYHPWIYLKSGLERSLLEIKRHSRHSWTIYTSYFDPEGTYPELREMGVFELERVAVKREYGEVVRAGLVIASTKLDLGSQDALVICCDGLGSLLTFRNSQVPIACLCFTPLRAVYDAEYRARHLRRHRAKLPFAVLAELIYRGLDRLAWRRYQQVICISNTVKERVVRGGLYRGEWIEVAYPGIAEDCIAAGETSEDFFFLPGRIMWTKNIELGIQAFLDFKKRSGLQYRLVVAGMVDAKSAPYFNRLQDMARADSAIEILINLSDQAMADLYARCFCVLLTAFNEDLGLTPLEGAARGKPTIAVDRGGPREIIEHETTGLLVADRVEAFSRAMERLATDPLEAARMGKQALEHSRSFTWTRFVNIIDNLLDRLGASNVHVPNS